MNPKVLYDIDAERAADAIATVESVELLDELRETERDHDQFDGGRKAVLEAIERRRTELETGRAPSVREDGDMRVRIEEGTPALRLDAQRTTSSRGGIYDLSGIHEPYKSNILEHEGVTVLDGDEPGEPEEVDATDAARELAEENDVNLNAIEGTGADGRILKSDVESVI